MIHSNAAGCRWIYKYRSIEGGYDVGAVSVQIRSMMLGISPCFPCYWRWCRLIRVPKGCLILFSTVHGPRLDRGTVGSNIFTEHRDFEVKPARVDHPYTVFTKTGERACRVRSTASIMASSLSLDLCGLHIVGIWSWPCIARSSSQRYVMQDVFLCLGDGGTF